MNIQLVNWKFNKVTFDLNHQLDSSSSSDENVFTFRVGNRFDDQTSKIFFIVFDFILHNQTFDLNIKAEYEFITDIDLDNEFKKSDFIKINAPAIAFPYLRAFVSNLTLSAGIDPVILPSVNFVEYVRNTSSLEEE